MSEFSLEHQLDQQMDNYADLGYGTMLGQTALEFSDRFSGLREAVAQLDIPEGSDMPLLAVIPTSLVAVKDQLELTGNRAYLKESEMRHASRFLEPDQPYALIDVDLGEDLTDLSAHQAAEIIFDDINRFGFRLVELISLAVHNRKAFDKRRGYYAIETEHVLEGEETAVVDLYRYGDQLKVKRDNPYINDPEWTTPSFSKLVVLDGKLVVSE